MNIYIGEPFEYNDMQGPAPTGFHVPLSSEWQAIYDAGVSLGAWSGSNGDNLSTYLKLPMAGYRDYSDLGFYGRTSYGHYWSSTPYNTKNAYSLFFVSSSIYQDYNSRSYGFSVRCVKNSPTIPTASWNVLYQGSGSAGIFHNPTDGLISISSDGTTWYTLMDKNLGATTVYSYGDALTEANCGKIYQWGNNYAFSGDANYDTSQISKSSTQVDVTGYGPGNYYNSSTWITTNPRQNSASDGNNLRGGVSQGTSTKSVEVKNIYIGEYGWKPTSPMCWYKFDGDYSEATGTYGVASGTSTFQTLSSGVKVLQTDGSNVVSLPSGITANSLSTYAIIFWMKPITTSPSYGYYAGCGNTNGSHISFYENTSGRDSVEWLNGSRDLTISGVGAGWRLVCFRSNGSNCDLIVNGSNKTATTTAPSIFGYSSYNTFVLGARNMVESATGQRTSVQISNFVISDSYWDDTTCLDMYNKTKADYGL